MLTEPWKRENPDRDRGFGFAGSAGPPPRIPGAPVGCETSCWNRWDGTTAPGKERISAFRLRGGGLLLRGAASRRNPASPVETTKAAVR